MKSSGELCVGIIPLDDKASGLARILRRSIIHTPAKYEVSEVHCETAMVRMRDGVRLATDVYLPPHVPAPTVAVRTPYGRNDDVHVGVYMSFARRGYVVVSQDCRGTGDSEPDSWDYYVYEPEDGHDFIDWIAAQRWFNGFLGTCRGSYSGAMQWLMATHPLISTIVPEVSGLGVSGSSLKSHMFVNAYARSVGKSESNLPVSYVDLEGQMIRETLASGYFNEPLYRPLPDVLLKQFPEINGLTPSEARKHLWSHYCSLSCTKRAGFLKEAFGVKRISILEATSWGSIFGHGISPYAPAAPRSNLVGLLHAPVLINTGWYDWGLGDTLASWGVLRNEASEPLRSSCRLFISPSAHNVIGYHEGIAKHPELQHAHRTATSVELLLQWYSAVSEGRLESWPRVVFYLMGANEWHCADDWPVPGVKATAFYLWAGGRLNLEPPREDSQPDRYIYDPGRPTPTVGGSIVSSVYPPGSVDVSEVQRRSDMLVCTSEPLLQDLDVVGPLRLVLYASSTAMDTDFVARLSDVFPDGRAIQLQNGVLRARYRDSKDKPELLEPGKIYKLEVDMWATANRFKAGHRLRVDISSSDFPRFERHSNRAGDGPPVAAVQTIYHDRQYSSYLLLPVLGDKAP